MYSFVASATTPSREVFPGAPETKGGYLYANDQPGLGMDIDEPAAAKYPYKSVGVFRNRLKKYSFFLAEHMAI